MSGTAPAPAPSYVSRVLGNDPTASGVSQPVAREIETQQWDQVEREGESRVVNGETHLKPPKNNCLLLKRRGAEDSVCQARASQTLT